MHGLEAFHFRPWEREQARRASGGLGFRAFRVWGFRVEGFKAQGLGFRV